MCGWYSPESSGLFHFQNNPADMTADAKLIDVNATQIHGCWVVDLVLGKE
jgi:hypothetical protein